MPKGTKPTDTKWRPPKGRLAVRSVVYSELKIGDRVKHRVAGEGEVVELSDGKVYVVFDKSKKGKAQMLKKSTAEKKLKLIVSASVARR